MAKKAKSIKEPEAKAPVNKPVSGEAAALSARVAALEAENAVLKAGQAELAGDLTRIAQLCGQVWGEPLASAALEIVSKRQGA